MNAAHLHLIVNHLPLFATLFGGALLAVGLYLRQKPLLNAGLALGIVAGVGAFLAVQSGERAEEIVEDQPAVAEATIENHEEAAEAALWASVLLGVLATVALAIPARATAAKAMATVVTLAITLVAFGLIARAANLGGLIRHPEISDGGAAYVGEQGGELEETEH